MSEDTVEIKDTPEVLLEKLRAANAEAKKYREERDTLQERVTQLETSANAAKESVKATAIRAALQEAGVSDERLHRLLKLDNVTVDDSGKLAGFDEALTNAKKEWPEFFDRKKRVGGRADATSKPEPKTELSVTERQVARIHAKQ